MPNLATNVAIITRSLNDVEIGQRAIDSYINATAMCQAAGKNFHDYERLQRTQDFLAVLSEKTGIPVFGTIGLVQAKQRLGTWIHPQVAISLAMWCSPEFEVVVTAWIEEWYCTHQPPVISHPPDPIRIKIENFTAIIQLRERVGMKPDRNVHLAIEALQGQAVDLPVVTLHARDLHYAEHFWSEKHKEGWRTHYSTNDAMINQLGRGASRICRERGIHRVENLQVIQSNNRLADVGLYPLEILEEALRHLVVNGKAYRTDDHHVPALRN